MTPVLLLRVSAIISLLFALGHSAGGLKKWSPMGDNVVLRTMTTTRFDTMGVSRSYLDFFMGFGWCLAIALLLQAILLWQLVGFAQSYGNPAARPMIATFAVAAFASASWPGALSFPFRRFFRPCCFSSWRRPIS